MLNTILLVAISEHTSVHDLQEFDDHSHRTHIHLIQVYKLSLLTLAQAHGEVLWFGGRVTGLTTVSFFFMVSCSVLKVPSLSALHISPTLNELASQVLSSLVAAWADIQAALALAPAPSAGVIDGSGAYEIVTGAVRQLNVGYLWMGVNCVISAAYVSNTPLPPVGCGY